MAKRIVSKWCRPAKNL